MTRGPPSGGCRDCDGRGRSAESFEDQCGQTASCTSYSPYLPDRWPKTTRGSTCTGLQARWPLSNVFRSPPSRIPRARSGTRIGRKRPTSMRERSAPPMGFGRSRTRWWVRSSGDSSTGGPGRTLRGRPRCSSRRWVGCAAIGCYYRVSRCSRGWSTRCAMLPRIGCTPGWPRLSKSSIRCCRSAARVVAGARRFPVFGVGAVASRPDAGVRAGSGQGVGSVGGSGGAAGAGGRLFGRAGQPDDGAGPLWTGELGHRAA